MVKAPPGVPAKVWVNVKMDIHGVVTLSSAQMVEEVEVETKEGEEKEKEKEKKDGGGSRCCRARSARRSRTPSRSRGRGPRGSPRRATSWSGSSRGGAFPCVRRVMLRRAGEFTVLAGYDETVTHLPAGTAQENCG